MNQRLNSLVAVFAFTSSILGFNSLAAAVTLHKCEVVSVVKGAKTAYGSVTKTFYVANGRSNFVDLYDQPTTFRFNLPSVGFNVDAYVNGQANFIFNGDMQNGSFESARNKGTVSCEAGVDVAAIYVGADGQGETTPATAGLMLGSCYAGSASRVAADLIRFEGYNASNISIEPTSKTVTASRVEKQCVDGSGTNPDDYVCRRYAPMKVSYSIKNCDYDPGARP